MEFIKFHLFKRLLSIRTIVITILFFLFTAFILQSLAKIDNLSEIEQIQKVINGIMITQLYIWFPGILVTLLIFMDVSSLFLQEKEKGYFEFYFCKSMSPLEYYVKRLIEIYFYWLLMILFLTVTLSLIIYGLFPVQIIDLLKILLGTFIFNSFALILLILFAVFICQIFKKYEVGLLTLVFIYIYGIFISPTIRFIHIENQNYISNYWLRLLDVNSLIATMYLKLFSAVLKLPFYYNANPIQEMTFGYFSRYPFTDHDLNGWIPDLGIQGNSVFILSSLFLLALIGAYFVKRSNNQDFS